MDVREINRNVLGNIYTKIYDVVVWSILLMILNFRILNNDIS